MYDGNVARMIFGCGPMCRIMGAEVCTITFLTSQEEEAGIESMIFEIWVMLGCCSAKATTREFPSKVKRSSWREVANLDARRAAVASP